jgi:hypothetical protein
VEPASETDSTVPNNKPAITILENEKGTFTLTDIAISGDGNLIKKEVEKTLKTLTLEIQRMWNVKRTGIPVIVWARGTISESFRKYLIRIPGKHDMKELRNTAILSTVHILREVLM